MEILVFLLVLHVSNEESVHRYLLIVIGDDAQPWELLHDLFNHFRIIYSFCNQEGTLPGPL